MNEMTKTKPSVLKSLLQSNSVRLSNGENISITSNILSRIDSPLAIINTDYVYEYINSAYHSKLFSQEIQLLGKKVSEIVGNSYFTNNIKPILKRVSQGEIIVKRYDNAPFPVSLVGSVDIKYYPVFNKREKVVAIMSVVSEVATDTLHQRRLLKNLKQWSSILNTIDDMVIVFDKFHKIEFVNKKGADILGDNIDDLLGQSCDDVLPGYICDKGKRKVKDTGKTQTSEGYYTIKGNHYSVKSSVINDIETGETKNVELFRDVTKIQDYSNRLQENQELLKKKNREYLKLNTELQIKNLRIENVINTLEISQRNYQQLFEKMDSALIILMPIHNSNSDIVDFIITDANPAYEVLIGLKAEQIIGKKLSSFSRVDSRTIKKYAYCASSGTTLKYEEFSTLFNKYVSTYIYTPVKGRLAIIIKDINDRKIAENQLVEHKERFRLALSTAELTVWDWKVKDNTLLRISRSKRNNTHERTEQLRPKDFLRIVHPDDMQVVIKKMKEVIYYNKSPKIEFRIIDRKKKVQWIQVRTSIHRDKSNRVERLIFTSHTISIRKRILEALKESKNQYRVIINNSNDAILIVSPNKTISYINSAGKKMFGYSIRELSSKNPDLLFFNNETYKLSDLYKTVAENKKYKSEIICVNKSCGRFHGEIYGNPIYLDGEVNYMLIVRDITDQISAKEEIIKAKDKAEESDRLKSAFLANMSHEIRTPMNGIIGFTQLLGNENIDNNKRKSYIGIVQKTTHQLLNIINDIISISKIEAGQLNINLSKIDINSIMNETYRLHVNEVEEKGLYLKLNNSQKQLMIFGDGTKLRQILSNLLSNAIKFTLKGHIEMGYNLINNQINFYVKDTGIGIGKEAQSVIFERFRQAELTTSRRFGGTGLGLSISKAYVNMMGGEINVNSTQGEGSTFYFTIPYTPSGPANDNKEESESNSENKQWENKKILVAEDEEINFLYLYELLRPTGIEIIRAENGEEAIDLFNENPDVKLILMDVKMPVLDGYEATKHIRQSNKDVPIIALTAYALEEDKQQAISSGCTMHLSKPILPEMLFDALEKFI